MKIYTKALAIICLKQNASVAWTDSLSKAAIYHRNTWEELCREIHFSALNFNLIDYEWFLAPQILELKYRSQFFPLSLSSFLSYQRYSHVYLFRFFILKICTWPNCPLHVFWFLKIWFLFFCTRQLNVIHSFILYNFCSVEMQK